MKDFILDSTYKDVTILNSNDDIFITSSDNLPYNSTPHHTIDFNRTTYNYSTTHNINNKFNIHNIIDYL